MTPINKTWISLYLIFWFYNIFLSFFSVSIRCRRGIYTCIECHTKIKDFASHFSLFVHCNFCKYSTNCNKAFVNHMLRWVKHVHGQSKLPFKIIWFFITKPLCHIKDLKRSSNRELRGYYPILFSSIITQELAGQNF